MRSRNTQDDMIASQVRGTLVRAVVSIAGHCKVYNFAPYKCIAISCVGCAEVSIYSTLVSTAIPATDFQRDSVHPAEEEGSGGDTAHSPAGDTGRGSPHRPQDPSEYVHLSRRTIMIVSI